MGCSKNCQISINVLVPINYASQIADKFKINLCYLALQTLPQDNVEAFGRRLIGTVPEIDDFYHHLAPLNYTPGFARYIQNYFGLLCHSDFASEQCRLW